MTHAPDQLSFEEIFAAEAREVATRHLPGDMEQAIPYFRGLIEQFHAAIYRADPDEALRLIDEAHDLAVKLNNGEPGILAGPDAPGYVLARATKAETGAVPLWGQTGDFIVTVQTMKVRIELDGMFGLATMPLPGFSAHIVEPDRPFISETGYRSFLGCQIDLSPGLTPDAFVTGVISEHVERSLKGKLRPLAKEYRERFMSPGPAP